MQYILHTERSKRSNLPEADSKQDYSPPNSSMDYELCSVSRPEHTEYQNYNAAESMLVANTSWFELNRSVRFIMNIYMHTGNNISHLCKSKCTQKNTH